MKKEKALMQVEVLTTEGNLYIVDKIDLRQNSENEMAIVFYSKDLCVGSTQAAVNFDKGEIMTVLLEQEVDYASLNRIGDWYCPCLQKLQLSKRSQSQEDAE